MPGYDYDLVTIGAGSGGVAASRRAVAYGARVAICENVRVGGTCVLRGCVPKKLLMYGSQYGDAFRDCAGYGWRTGGPAVFDWPTLLAAKERELDRLNGTYLSLLKGSGVTVFEGFARLGESKNASGGGREGEGGTVEIAGRRLSARHILIATGGTPTRLPIPGAGLAITSDQALTLPALPERLLILGGGYIAVEFASIFAGFGVAVTILIRAPHILNGFDDDLRIALEDELRKRGVGIETGVRPLRIDGGENDLAVIAEDGRRFPAPAVLMATGRHPNTEGLGLTEAGVQTGPHGAIMVDAWSRTSAPGIYAVGDVTDRMALTPVAVAEGRAVVETLFNDTPTQISYDTIPTAVFSSPAIGTVGLSEAAARAGGHTLDIYRSRFRPMKHTLTGRDEKTLVKLVVDRADGRVLGCHMLGADAPEIIQGLAIALKCGATKRDFDRTIALHPSAAEEFVLLHDPLPAA